MGFTQGHIPSLQKALLPYASKLPAQRALYSHKAASCLPTIPIS